VQEVVEQIENDVPVALHAKQTALDSLGTWRSACIALLILHHTITSSGLPVPGKRPLWHLALPLFVLFVGDWAIVTVAFQVFGLSDKPWVPGLGFTDDLHLAALTSVFVLIFLSHGAGDKLRRVPTLASGVGRPSARRPRSHCRCCRSPT
jgi:hypothetical protein